MWTVVAPLEGSPPFPLPPFSNPIAAPLRYHSMLASKLQEAQI